MDKIKALNGYALIEVESTTDDKTSTGLYKDISFDTHGKMTIKAKCISVPTTGSTDVIHEIHEGFPRYSRQYTKGGSERTYLRNKDLPVTIQEGDLLYFHYLTLEDPYNFMGVSEGKQIWRVNMNDIFCAVRSGEIIMLNGYVLAEKYYGEGWELIDVDGKSIPVRQSKSGLITSIQDEPLKNHAVIKHISSWDIGAENRYAEIDRENIVVTRDDIEFVNEIEGKEYWVFQHRDILAKRTGSRFIPVANLVHIQPNEKMYNGSIIVDKAYLNTQQQGTFISAGRNTSDIFIKGYEVAYHLNDKNHRILEDDTILIEESDIYGIKLENIGDFLA